MLTLSKRIITILIFFFSSLIVQAKDAEVLRMLSDINAKQSTPALKQQAIAAGKDRAVLCNQCHGADGNSTKPDVPNLAAQNPVYLLEQIEKFADGRRKNFVMNALSKNFSRDDKENLAIFYASLRVRGAATNPQLAKKGQPIYAKQCSACHGENGVGQADFARLAGQQVQYVETTLMRFRDNSKNSNPSSNRSNVIMESIVKGLTDDEIKAVAAYLGQLK